MRYLLTLISLVAVWFPAAWVAPTYAAGVPDSSYLGEACYWLEHAQVGRDASFSSADYVSGVDAYGREVAPANARRPGVSPPEILEFNIRVDLAADLPQGSLPVHAYQTVARITLNTVTGEIYIDGERLGTDEEIELAARCAEATQSSQ